MSRPGGAAQPERVAHATPSTRRRRAAGPELHRPRLASMLTAIACCCSGLPVHAQTAVPSMPARAPISCIGDDLLRMAPGGPSAWLDDPDRAVVLAELMVRYPTLERDGLDAQAVLLWRHPDGDWRYAALIPDLRTPGTTCVAASFTATSVTPTAALLRKYFFIGGDRS